MRLSKGQLNEISREMDCLERELYRLDNMTDSYSDMLRDEIIEKYDVIIDKLDVSYNLAVKEEKEKRMSRFTLIQGGKI